LGRVDGGRRAARFERLEMFTGLVECIAELRAAQRRAGLVELSLAVPLDLSDSKIGDSFCVQGACLTAVGFAEGTVRVEVSQETLDRTTLGSYQPGRRLNVERALRLSDRLGGHLVTGHVDGMGHLIEKKQTERNVDLKFRASPSVARYLVEKGSICVDGVSLTLGVCEKDTFMVYLIPHTLKETTLQFLRPGDPVNLEADIIGKYVEKLLSQREPSANPAQGVSQDLLEKHGFVSPPKR
jgi:riboflavin synthase